MSHQIVKIFKKSSYADEDIDIQCNNYLKEHPTYIITHISTYATNPRIRGLHNVENLCIVFNTNEIN